MLRSGYGPPYAGRGYPAQRLKTKVRRPPGQLGATNPPPPTPRPYVEPGHMKRVYGGYQARPAKIKGLPRKRAR